MRIYKILSFFIKQASVYISDPDDRVSCLPNNNRFNPYQKASILNLIRRMPNPLRAVSANWKWRTAHAPLYNMLTFRSTFTELANVKAACSCLLSSTTGTMQVKAQPCISPGTDIFSLQSEWKREPASSQGRSKRTWGPPRPRRAWYIFQRQLVFRPRHRQLFSSWTMCLS